MKQTLGFGLIVLFLAAVLAMDCAAQKAPADSQFMAIQSVSVLPIVDARADKKTNVNAEKLQDKVVKHLDKMHYPAGAASTSGEAGEIIVEDVEKPTPSYVKKLGPVNERWVMVIFLDDVYYSRTARSSLAGTGGSNVAELKGFLFDKDTGALVWKHKGIGEVKGLGPAGSEKALDEAIKAMLRSLPDRPKN